MKLIKFLLAGIVCCCTIVVVFGGDDFAKELCERPEVDKSKPTIKINSKDDTDVRMYNIGAPDACKVAEPQFRFKVNCNRASGGQLKSSDISSCTVLDKSSKWFKTHLKIGAGITIKESVAFDMDSKGDKGCNLECTILCEANDKPTLMCSSKK